MLSTVEASTAIRELELIKYYRKNPVIAAEDLLRVQLAFPQQQVLEDMWFKNFVLITAGRGTGKCVSGETLIPTSNGLVEIASLGSELEILSSLEIGVQGKDHINTTSKWYYDGVQQVNRITTSFGYTISSTDEHPFLVLADSGEFRWEKSKDIKENDYVAIQREYSVSSSINHLSEQQAIFCGLLVGGGCFRGNKYHLSFTSGELEIRELYSSIFEKEFGYSPRLVDGGVRCPSLLSTRKDVWVSLLQWGLENNIKSVDKIIPKGVLRSSKRIISKFLSGLFEVDGGCEKSSVTFCTKSNKLSYQVHQALLYLGIVSKRKRKLIKYKDAYHSYNVISITGAGIDLFSERVGFLSSRKKASLYKLVGKECNTNIDTIPGLSSLWYGMWDKTRGHLTYSERERLKRYKYGQEKPSYKSIRAQLKQYPFSDQYSDKLEKINDKHYFFDKVCSVEKGFDKVYDLVVPGDHSFSGGGFVNHNTFLQSVFACLWALLYPGQKVGLLAPSFRQAKTMFAEVDRRWSESPLLQEATLNKPIRASDRCYLAFRSPSFKVGSVIEAVPLGDGSKIRGARYYAILADEFAQIPEGIFNTVILPMGATVADPMENVNKISRQRALIASGKATAADFEDRVENKVIATSSAFYQFNHMYQTKLEYAELIRRGDTNYAIHNISFRDMPEGFLSESSIKNAQVRMSTLEFSMEYEAKWEADSSGVFKASLIEKCKQAATHTIDLKGSPGAEYILGVDPARVSDAFSLCLIEIGTTNKIIAAWEYYENSFPDMAKTVMQLCTDFNVVYVHMDAGAGGGGLAMKDLLAEEERWGASMRILDAEDEDYANSTGRKILHLFNPSPKSNAEAVYASLALMEQGLLTFPMRPQPKGTTPAAFEELEKVEAIYDTVDIMLRQMMIIEVSESRSGVAHFDVPTGGGHAAQKKDLFTAFILASKIAHDLSLSEETVSSILEIGIVEQRHEFRHIPKSNLTESMDVMQTPFNSWAFKKTFKPG